MKRRVAPLAIGTFAVGTDGFVIAGVLPDIARDLDIDIGQAGLLVTGFAVVYALAAPALGLALSWIRPRLLLAGSMSVFAVANLLAAAAPSYGALFGCRVLAALAAAVYSPAAVAAAVRILPDEMRGRAASMVFGGLAVSLVTGVPLGTYVSHASNWRATFVLVSALAALAMLGVRSLVPPLPQAPVAALSDRLVLLRQKPLVIALLSGFVWMTGAFAFYTFISQLLRASTSWSTAALGPILLLYGMGAIAGNHLGGRGTDGALGESRTLVTALAVLVVAYGALALGVQLGTPSGVVLGPLAIAVLAVAGWACTPPQAHRVISLAPGSSTEVLALNTTANYLGIGAGAALGAALLEHVAVGAIPLLAAVCQLVGIAGVKYVDRLRERSASGMTSNDMTHAEQTIPAK